MTYYVLSGTLNLPQLNPTQCDHVLVSRLSVATTVAKSFYWAFKAYVSVYGGIHEP